MNPPPADLKARFTTWCLQHGASEAAAAHLWTQLSTLYTEAHRHYHHLGHIASFFEMLGGRLLEHQVVSPL